MSKSSSRQGETTVMAPCTHEPRPRSTRRRHRASPGPARKAEGPAVLPSADLRPGGQPLASRTDAEVPSSGVDTNKQITACYEVLSLARDKLHAETYG